MALHQITLLAVHYICFKWSLQTDPGLINFPSFQKRSFPSDDSFNLCKVLLLKISPNWKYILKSYKSDLYWQGTGHTNDLLVTWPVDKDIFFGASQRHWKYTFLQDYLTLLFFSVLISRSFSQCIKLNLRHFLHKHKHKDFHISCNRYLYCSCLRVRLSMITVGIHLCHHLTQTLVGKHFYHLSPPVPIQCVLNSLACSVKYSLSCKYLCYKLNPTFATWQFLVVIFLEMTKMTQQCIIIFSLVKI